jgi:hypothetical protein
MPFSVSGTLSIRFFQLYLNVMELPKNNFLRNLEQAQVGNDTEPYQTSGACFSPV